MTCDLNIYVYKLSFAQYILVCGIFNRADEQVTWDNYIAWWEKFLLIRDTVNWYIYLVRRRINLSSRGWIKNAIYNYWHGLLQYYTREDSVCCSVRFAYLLWWEITKLRGRIRGLLEWEFIIVINYICEINRFEEKNIVYVIKVIDIFFLNLDNELK